MQLIQTVQKCTDILTTSVMPVENPAYMAEDLVTSFIDRVVTEAASDASINKEQDYYFEFIKSPERLLDLEEFINFRFGKFETTASKLIDAIYDDFSDIARLLSQNTKAGTEDTTRKFNRKELRDNIKSWKWRVRNIYKIVDKGGRVVKFSPNPVQNFLIDNLHSLNWVLKSRRHGASTLFAIIILDQILFHGNKNAAIIAHGLREVRHLFKTKILFPYQHLPSIIKDARPSISKSANEIELNNGSTFYVTVSTRSGTLHYVLISELGITYWNSPAKAEEIVSGTLESVDKGQFAVVESTPYGMTGYRDRTVRIQQQYLSTIESGRKLEELQYRFFFLPWFEDPNNTVTEPVELTEDEVTYFRKLELESGKILSPLQKAWYALKVRTLGETTMWREHPSTVDESFRGSVEGAFFTEEMGLVYSEGRIIPIEYDPTIPLHIAWDLGIGDYMVLLFFQVKDGKRYAVHCYVDNGHNLEHYIRYIEKSVYGFDDNTILIFPHDIAVREQTLQTSETRLMRLASWTVKLKSGRRVKLGSLNIKRAARSPTKREGIDLVADNLGKWYFNSNDFNESNPKTGVMAFVRALSSYGREFHKTTGTYSDKPKHDEHSHLVDAGIVAEQYLNNKAADINDILPY